MSLVLLRTNRWLRQDARMRKRSAVLVGLLTAVLLPSAAAGATPIQVHVMQSKATVRTFAGDWYGHTRGLVISKHGHGQESIGNGCCDEVIKLRFHLSAVRGGARHASAKARVTHVHVYDHSYYSRSNPPPHVGEVRRITLRRGVINEKITGTNYCNMHADMTGACGA